VTAIAVAQAIAHVYQDYYDKEIDADALVSAYDLGIWLRPEQRIPRGPWRSYGFIAGRGFGKTFAIAHEVNRRVEAGECRTPALVAPTDARVQTVQIANLIETAPPWFRPIATNGSIVWPNGVTAEVFSAEREGRARSSNLDLTWMTEIVDWAPSFRLELYRNIATATRVRGAQLIWDTTSKGTNDVIQLLVEAHERDPVANRLVRGQIFDNPMLSKSYLREVCGLYPKGSQRYREELFGEVFAESAGALWQWTWIESNRVTVEPTALDLQVIGLDPALSARSDADETGIVLAGRTSGSPRDRQLYVLDDQSGHHTPEDWASIVVDLCVRGASGVVVERNHAGDMPATLIKLHAARRGLSVRMLADDGRPFPARTPGVAYVRPVVSRTGKEVRANAPAALYAEGRVHHVGVYDRLEAEQTTWEAGSKKSPNRLDALCFAINELADTAPAHKDVPVGAVATTVGTQHTLPSGLRANAGRGRLGR